MPILTKTEKKTLDAMAEEAWFELLLDAFEQRSAMTKGDWHERCREIELKFSDWINDA